MGDLIDEIIKLLEEKTAEKKEEESSDFKAHTFTLTGTLKNGGGLKDFKVEDEDGNTVALDQIASIDFGQKDEKKEMKTERTALLHIEDPACKSYFAANNGESVEAADIFSAAMYAAIRTVGTASGMEGKALDDFVIEYAETLSDKMMDTIRELALRKLKELIEGVIE